MCVCDSKNLVNIHKIQKKKGCHTSTHISMLLFLCLRVTKVCLKIHADHTTPFFIRPRTAMRAMQANIHSLSVDSVSLHTLERGAVDKCLVCTSYVACIIAYNIIDMPCMHFYSLRVNEGMDEVRNYSINFLNNKEYTKVQKAHLPQPVLT